MIKKHSKYCFSEDSLNFIFRTSMGYITPSQVEQLVEILENETANHNFTKASEANLMRIFTNLHDHSMFFREMLKYPHHSEIVIAIAANSNYLVDVIAANPEFLNFLFNPSIFFKKYRSNDYHEELYAGINAFKTFGGKINFIRLYKRRNTLRIGLADILKVFELTEITTQISQLASTVSAVLLDLCVKEISDKFGLSQAPKQYALISLGKLGGGELNYSSDIDFMCIYEKNFPIGEAGKDFYDLLSVAVKLFIQIATEVSAKGFLYRVDFRLRPDGMHSPLCRTLKDTIIYYETRGAEWERQMLLKAGFAGGDKSLFDSFILFTKSYCFETVSSGVFRQVRKMKAAIEERLKDDLNIKLSAGGIRDIEFSVQALQMIYGKKIKNLYTGNTLQAIEILKNNKLLSGNEAEKYINAYILFRRIEHYLQLMNNNQTHSLPQAGELIEKIADFLDYNSAEEFSRELNLIKQETRKIYLSITAADEKENQQDYSVIKFSNQRNAIKDLNFLKTGLSIFNQNEFDRRTVQAFEKIEQTLFDFLQSSDFPDEVLANFTRIIRIIKFPSIWYKEFEDLKFFNAFLKICEFNKLGIEEIISKPAIAESILTRKAIIPAAQDKLHFMNSSEARLALSSQFILKEIDTKSLSKRISNFVEFFIRKAIPEFNITENFFLAGLGSYGTKNMSFSSDIDIIFVVDEFENFEETQNKFQKLFNTLKGTLKGFELDCRLRPEGGNSQLVWDINAYRIYLSERARLWEFMAFSKIHFITGNEELFNNFTNLINSNFNHFSFNEAFHEIEIMYKKIISNSSPFASSYFDFKNSRGGLLDIDFAVQYCIVKFGNLEEILNLSMKQRLEFFAEKFNYIADHLILLAENYSRLKKYQIAVQCIENKRKSRISKKHEDNKKLADFLGLSPIEFINEIDLLLRKNYDTFLKIKNEIFNEIA